MRLTFSRKARRDLTEIADFIAIEDATAAKRFVMELMDVAARLVTRPQAYSRQPGTDFHKKPFRSYVIYYAVRTDSIHIVTFRHAARATVASSDLDRWAHE